MERINLESIDFNKLHQINSKYHAESNLFYDEETIYKIFMNLPTYSRDKKQRKIQLLQEGDALSNVIMPIDELFYQGIFTGYTMEYIKGSIPLFDINKRSRDINLFFHIVSIISKSLEEIHHDPRDILVGDLNFDNIIIDKFFNPYFIDFDSCQIDGILNEQIPAMLNYYLLNRDITKVDTTRNTDRFNLLLCTLYTIFKKHIDAVSMYQYDKKAEKVETLRNLREFVLETKKFARIPEVPYLHEIISPRDIEPRNIKKRTPKRI